MFPSGLAPAEVREARLKLAEFEPALAQLLLDELAGRIIGGGIRGSPLAYLRGLVRRAAAGTFEPEAGLRVAAQRELDARHEAALRRAASALPPIPPVDENHPIARRVAQIRARRAAKQDGDEKPS